MLPLAKMIRARPDGNLRQILRWAGLAALALAVAACGGGPSYPKVAKLDGTAVVLAFGDSLTFGTGAGAADSYPAVLERLIGRRVVRSGVPGEVSEEGLARLPEVLDEVKPGLLILCHGGNDFLRKMDEVKAKENVREMVKMARERNIGVILMATPRPGLGIKPPPFYGEIGTEFSIPVEGAILGSVLGDRNLKADLVHPNAEGYRKVAEALEKVLKKSGAI